jgi:spore maturation protein SpmB
MSTFVATFKRGALNGLAITYEMVKVIVPFYIAIEFLKHTRFLGFVSEIFRPLMRLFGLPGEAALGLMAGYFVNLYAAIAVLVPLNLPAKEITVVALMLGIAHSLPLETAVTRQTGVNAWLMLLARVLFSLLSGIVLNLLWISFS